jgi:hypothetical protein
MRTLAQVDYLALWESGRRLHPIDQGLLAVQTAFPETRGESVADWPLGRRNRALAELQCACFGPTLSGWTVCRQCGEKLEFRVDGEALAQTAAGDATEPVSIDGRRFRLPTSRDLARIAELPDAASAARHLLELCLLSRDEGEAAHAWSEQELDSAGERLALADPLAEVLLHFQCPVCNQSFEESLDLAVFLWSEFEGRAKRLLFDVHTLASAYGWSEAEVLALSPARRNFYLEMVHS